MRLFIGTILDDDNQRFYRRLAGDLIARHGRLLRHVPPGSVHVTHAFGGEVPEDRLDDVRRVVENLAARTAPIDIALGPPRVQFAGRDARLLCADVGEGAGALRALVAALEEALARACAAVAWKPTRSPHVTIARFRRGARRGDAGAVAASLPPADGLVRADRVAHLQIVESRLSSAGAEYAVIHEASLAGEPSGIG